MADSSATVPSTSPIAALANALYGDADQFRVSRYTRRRCSSCQRVSACPAILKALKRLKRVSSEDTEVKRLKKGITVTVLFLGMVLAGERLTLAPAAHAHTSSRAAYQAMASN